MNKPAVLISNSWYQGTDQRQRPPIGLKGHVTGKYTTTEGAKVVIFKPDNAQFEYTVPKSAVRF